MSESLRAWLDVEGLRVCRDTVVKRGANRGKVQAQHLKAITASGDLEWANHEEGAIVPTVRAEPDCE